MTDFVGELTIEPRLGTIVVATKGGVLVAPIGPDDEDLPDVPDGAVAEIHSLESWTPIGYTTDTGIFAHDPDFDGDSEPAVDTWSTLTGGEVTFTATAADIDTTVAFALYGGAGCAPRPHPWRLLRQRITCWGRTGHNWSDCPACGPDHQTCRLCTSHKFTD